MYKISGLVIRFTDYIMKNKSVEQTVGRKRLIVVKIHWGIFHRDTLWPQLWALMQLKKKKKINRLMHMDNIKLFTKNEKELETLIRAVQTYIQDTGMEISVEKCVMQ